jgi:hypothetical protein
MIENIMINGIEARAIAREAVKEFETDIKIEGVEVKESKVYMGFVWNVAYGKNSDCYLKMDGLLIANEQPSDAKKIHKTWQESKSLPPEFMAVVLNAVNYYCTANGVNVAQTMNIAPPMKIPTIELKGQEE